METIYEDIASASHLSAVTRYNLRQSVKRLFSVRPFPKKIVLKVVPQISEKESTQMTLYGRILSVMKLSPTFRSLVTEAQRKSILREFEILKDQESKRRAEGATRPNDILWEDLLACEKKFPPKSEAMLIHRLYTDLPAVRNDFTPVRIVQSMADTKDTQLNYFVIDPDNENMFILNVYKTNKRYGQQVFFLPDSIVSLVPTHQEYLFQTAMGGPVQPNTLSKKVARAYKRFCGLEININAIRRSYAFHTLKTRWSGDTPPVDEAIAQGHSLATHRTYAARG